MNEFLIDIIRLAEESGIKLEKCAFSTNSGGWSEIELCFQDQNVK